MMVTTIRAMRLRTRLLAAFGVVCVLLVAVATVGLRASQQQRSLAGQVGQMQLLTRDVMELKFRDADVSGWQVAYAWDVPFIGGPAATAEDSANRKGFLDSAHSLQGELAGVHTAFLTAAEHSLFDQINQSFTGFLDYDNQVVALFRQNTAASIKAANALIVGPGYDAYYKIMDATDKLITSVKQRADAVQRQSVQAADRARGLILGGVAVALVVALGLALLITTSVVRPVQNVVASLRTLAGRDLGASLQEDGRDEVTDIAREFNATAAAIRAALTGVGTQAGELTSAGGQLSSVSQRLDRQAADTSDQAVHVSRAAEDVSSNINALAAAAEQMNAAIDEIARNTSTAAGVAAEAVSSATATAGTVATLAEASSEIGQIVKTITSIAAQTNLLALNATIEAARAGDAGRGFAIVASEVKDLAQGTTRASEDIISKIDAIQAETDRATVAIRGISGIVERIAEIQSVVAAAVEEQSATTKEINRSVTELAAGSHQIAQTVAGVAQTATATTNDAAATRQAAADLSTMAGQLHAIVSSFRY